MCDQSPANPGLARCFADSTLAASTSLRPIGVRLPGQLKKSCLPELTHLSWYKQRWAVVSAIKYVYLIQSTHPDEKFGLTSDVNRRLRAHNEGRSPDTAKVKPWKLVASVAFSDESKALDFEKYLKSGSGRAFANRKFWGS
ncbi:MAG: GIY-YIG nuclease family protein [Desulfobacterales bacterium]|nr:MAG: GIY-YIG nuclease family protein [Desulfobacterales bacterium]